jgi:hypothetical protein
MPAIETRSGSIFLANCVCVFRSAKGVDVGGSAASAFLTFAALIAISLSGALSSVRAEAKHTAK